MAFWFSDNYIQNTNDDFKKYLQIIYEELDKGRFKKILTETGDIERITSNYLSTDFLFL